MIVESFVPKSLCILGRQPALGLAELESLYGPEHVRPIGGAALLDIEASEINFKRLGGTLKVARILNELNTTAWPAIKKYLLKNVPAHLENMPEGKFTLGLSVYGLTVPLNSINQTTLEIKKQIKRSGRPVRVVPNKELSLNSAQVLHNKLTHKGAWELLVVKNSNKAILAQTFFVQDIEAYADRDQTRPKRDARVGMLPPKLAQIIVNLATSQIDEQSAVGNEQKVVVLDPFCGTGVVLQESLLMGYSVLGSDINPRMVEYTKANLDWLCAKFQIPNAKFQILSGDATEFQWPLFNMVASEASLGPPMSYLPPADKLSPVVNNVNLVVRKFLKNLQPQLPPGGQICLAVPAWRKPNGELINLPVIDQLTDMGYNWVEFQHVEAADLVYFRESQTVARRLLVLNKKV